MLLAPTGGRPGVSWLISQAVRAGWRTRQDRIMTVAGVGAAVQFKSDYGIAKSGG